MSQLLSAFVTSTESDITALVERVRDRLVLVQSRSGFGSGVLWTQSGLIVTNHHVAPGRGADIELTDGRRFTTKVVAHDTQNDLALLRIIPDGLAMPTLPVPEIGDSRKLRVGEIVVAVGNPLGVRGTATLGMISATNHQDRVFADVQLAPGNSGGPLVNSQGEIIGIASMIISPGIAVAIPSHIACEFVEQALLLERRREKVAA